MKAFRTSMIESEKNNSDHQDEDTGMRKIMRIEEEEEESDVDREADEYDLKESNHKFAFHGFIKRLSCFAHTLQLVVYKFKEVKSLKKVLASAHALVKKVNKSFKTTERLVYLCRKKLISDCPTRWSSTFLMIERLLDVKDALSTVLEELCWDNLHTSEWKLLASIHDLLKPFAQYTSLVGGEDYTTVSSFIPIVMEINLHLEESRQSPLPQVSTAARVLLTEFKRRFQNVTDPSHPDHDPLFLASTLLDPRYRLLLNPNQIMSAKAHLMNLFKRPP